MKTFVDFIKYANKQPFYMGPTPIGLAKCKFEAEFIKFFGIQEQELVHFIANINISSLQGSSNWKDAILMSLEVISMNGGDGIDRVLKSWIPSLEENIELADMVLYYGFWMTDEVLDHWVEECKRLAIITENESLIESLIYRLGVRVKDDESLKKVIDKKLIESEKVKRAF